MLTTQFRFRLHNLHVADDLRKFHSLKSHSLKGFTLDLIQTSRRLHRFHRPRWLHRLHFRLRYRPTLKQLHVLEELLSYPPD